MNCQATSLKSRSERQKIQNSNQYPYFGSYLQGFCFIKCKMEMIFMFYLFLVYFTKRKGQNRGGKTAEKS